MIVLIHPVHYSLAENTIVSVGDEAYNYAGNRFLYIQSNQTFWVIVFMINFYHVLLR